MPSLLPAQPGLAHRGYDAAHTEAAVLASRHGVRYTVKYDKGLRRYRAEVADPIRRKK